MLTLNIWNFLSLTINNYEYTDYYMINGVSFVSGSALNSI